MKKLALLLGALSLVSSVAYAKEVVPAVEEVVVVEEAVPVAAAPALTVTSFGQGIEFDYCTVHAVKTLKKLGIESIKSPILSVLDTIILLISILCSLFIIYITSISIDLSQFKIFYH